MAGMMSEVPEFCQTGRDHAQSVEMSARLAAPDPLPVLAAMANELTRKEYRLMAVALLLGLQRYLRLGELVQLHKVDLIGAKKGVLDSWRLIVCPQERNRPTKKRELGTTVSSWCNNGAHAMWLFTKGLFAP